MRKPHLLFGLAIIFCGMGRAFAAPPQWIDACTTGPSGCCEVPAAVGAVSSLDLKAGDSDGNSLDIRVHLEPGLPVGASFGQLILNSPPSVSSVKRTLSFTPQTFHGGHSVSAAFYALDDTGLQSATQCVVFNVSAAKPQYDGLTNGQILSVSARCKRKIDLRVTDSTGVYNATAMLDTPQSTLPPDTTVEQVSSDHVRVHIQAPRGTEGRSYSLCFKGGDAQGLSTLPPLCATVRVERCRVCAGEGESLKSVATEYGRGASAITIYNHNPAFQDPDVVLQDTLEIAVGNIYRIKDGDTLSGLAARFHTTVQQLLSVNPLVTDPEKISVGEELCVTLCTV